MISARKYAADYRLENVLNKKGKLVTVPVYSGNWYRFSSDTATVRRARILYSVLTFLNALLFGGALFVVSPCTKTFYVMIPFAAMVFTVFFSLASLLRLWRAGEKVTREHAHKTSDRYNTCIVMNMIFSGISFVGHIVYMFLEKETGMDVVVLLCTIGIFVSSLVMFLRRADIRMEVITDKPVYCGTDSASK